MITFAWRYLFNVTYIVSSFVVVFLIFSAAPSHAEDLSEIYELAKSNDPRFRGSIHEHAASKEIKKQAWSKLLPSVNAEYEQTQTTQDIVSTDNTVFGIGQTAFDTNSMTVTLVQPIFEYPSIVGLSQAKVALRRSDAELEFARQELILRVADAYLKALGAQDRLLFAEKEERSVERHYELANGRYKRGLVSITDKYDAKARLALVKAQTIEAENELRDSFQGLKELTDVLPEGLSVLKENVPLINPDPQDIETWIEAAMKQNIAVKIQLNELEIAGKEISRQKGEHYPTLGLMVRHNQKETGGTLFGGGSEIDTQDIIFVFRMPLYNGGIVRSRTREARQFRMVAEQSLMRERRAAVRQTRASYLGVQSNIKRVGALASALEAQTLVLNAKQEGFKAGLYTSLAVLDAGRDLYMAKRDYAQARYDYILNTLKLKFAVGTLAEEDVIAVNGWLN